MENDISNDISEETDIVVSIHEQTSNDQTSFFSVQSKVHLKDYLHLRSVFGDDWFAIMAEKFARFFGTPLFLVAQTIIVFIWILINVIGWTSFDHYPFILLNLAFSLQAAYAAPLILLAQTRQADREKIRAESDAIHREDVAQTSEQHLILLEQYHQQLIALLEQNTKLTRQNQRLSKKIENMTVEIQKQFYMAKIQSQDEL